MRMNAAIHFGTDLPGQIRWQAVQHRLHQLGATSQKLYPGGAKAHTLAKIETIALGKLGAHWRGFSPTAGAFAISKGSGNVKELTEFAL